MCGIACLGMLCLFPAREVYCVFASERVKESTQIHFDNVKSAGT